MYFQNLQNLLYTSIYYITSVKRIFQIAVQTAVKI